MLMRLFVCFLYFYPRMWWGLCKSLNSNFIYFRLYWSIGVGLWESRITFFVLCAFGLKMMYIPYTRVCVHTHLLMHLFIHLFLLLPLLANLDVFSAPPPKKNLSPSHKWISCTVSSLKIVHSTYQTLKENSFHSEILGENTQLFHHICIIGKCNCYQTAVGIL